MGPSYRARQTRCTRPASPLDTEVPTTMTTRRLAFAAGLLAAALARHAAAAELSQGKLFLNGYGGAAYGRTQHNEYGFANEEGEYDSRFALALVSRHLENIVLGASVEFTGEGEMDVDWAFLEWRISDLFRLRAGQAKHAFGLYAETRDVGTVRPFYSLPASVYGPVGLTAESYVGLGATGQVRSGRGWGLDYDVYAGDLRVEVFDMDEVLLPGAPPVPPEESFAHLHDMLGGRVGLATPVPGLGFRFSAYRARREEVRAAGEESVTLVAFGPAVEYLTDRTSVRAEYYRLTHGDETTDTGYLEAAQYLGEHVQVAARVEALQAKVEGIPDSTFLRHREAAVGLNYWVNPDVVFKGSFHLVDGNRLVLPELVGPAETPEERTWMLMLGSQFSF